MSILRIYIYSFLFNMSAYFFYYPLFTIYVYGSLYIFYSNLSCTKQGCIRFFDSDFGTVGFTRTHANTFLWDRIPSGSFNGIEHQMNPSMRSNPKRTLLWVEVLYRTISFLHIQVKYILFSTIKEGTMGKISMHIHIK